MMNILKRLFVCLLFLSGCSEVPKGFIPIETESGNATKLLQFYFGSFVSPEGGNPFEADLLLESSGKYYLNLEKLASLYPSLSNEIKEKEKLSWTEVKAFLVDAYYEARQVPITLDEFALVNPYADNSDWFTVELEGMMTQARRKIYVSKDILRTALTDYKKNNNQLLYPSGTVIIGEHFDDGVRFETTVMQKRGDGFWDYIVYDQEGKLARETKAMPKKLSVPTQCSGCHFGSKLFEPEKSFPKEAPDGPNGPRKLYFDAPVETSLVLRFQEHAKRSDTILGMYNTLFIATLEAQKRNQTISETDNELLQLLNMSE